MGTNHDKGRTKQRAARALAKAEGIKYTEALREVENRRFSTPLNETIRSARDEGYAVWHVTYDDDEVLTQFADTAKQRTNPLVNTFDAEPVLIVVEGVRPANPTPAQKRCIDALTVLARLGRRATIRVLLTAHDVLSGVEAQPVPEPIRAQPHDEPRTETNSGFAHGDRSTCRVCGEPIKFYAHWDYIGVEAADWRDSYVLNDAWWVHDSHPADEHDAEPVDAGRDAQIRAAAAAVKVGNRIKFGPSERRWWTVRERNKRYIVATRQQPFAAKGIEQYTVIDLTGWTSTYNGIGPGVVRSSLNTLDGGWDQMMRWSLDDSEDEAEVVPWWTGILDALTGGRFEISARRVMRVEHLIAR